jgi:hypothetical protein
MHAIQFVTTPEEGKIEIPKEYQNELKDQILVIIVKNVPTIEAQTPRKKRVLSAPKIKTKGFKFNRDEANER